VIVNYQVVADIYVPYGVDTATVLEKATAALNEYTASVHLINATAARSGIDGALHQTALSPSICIHRRRRRCDDGRSPSLHLC
jgi:phage-related baseplate assembly protein